MESRTSPGKRGSVQPISVSLMAFAHPFPAWVSRPVVPVLATWYIRSQKTTGFSYRYTT